jgi:hypothetical protein
MKKLILSVIACATVTLTAEVSNRPEAGLTVKVFDQDSRPMTGVDVLVTFELPKYRPGVWGSADMLTKRGKSNEKGMFSVVANAGSYAGFAAEAPGYYKSRGTIEFKSEKQGRYEPWNPTVTLTLKRIINPVPMYARRFETEIPMMDGAVGFDLIESDWVRPHGRGKLSDIRFKITKRVDSFTNFGAELVVDFSNKGDGIALMSSEIQGGSELCSSHVGPDEGYTEFLSFLQGNSKERGQYGMSDKSANYFIRVRTVLDDRGAVVSALYGKIYGGIEFFPVSSKTAKIRFTYYLNPVSNDRNIEFDPKRNLFTNLKELEKPTAP